MGSTVESISSIHVDMATKPECRQAISCSTELAAKRHLYQSKGLDLLSPSMRVLIGTVGYGANDNRKQGGVAIVDDFKASTTREKSNLR